VIAARCVSLTTPQRLPEVKVRRARYYTEEEIQAILDAAAEIELEGPVLLALNLGLRAGEIVHLAVSDVDFKNHLIHVQAKPDWRPKDYEERSIEMNEKVSRFLVGWLSRPERSLSPYLFPGVRAQSKRGREANRLSVGFGRLLRCLGIRNGDFHTLQHIFASYHAMADTDLRTLQLALGHANLRTTQRYAHLKPSHRAGITKRVRFGRLSDAPVVHPFPR
jgi:integrase